MKLEHIKAYEAKKKQAQIDEMREKYEYLSKVVISKTILQNLEGTTTSTLALRVLSSNLTKDEMYFAMKEVLYIKEIQVAKKIQRAHESLMSKLAK